MGNYQSLDASVFLHALDLITDFVLVTNYFSNDSTPIIKEITLHNDNVKYINEPLRKHLGFNSVDIQELTGKIYNVTTVGDGNYCGLAVISQANHENTFFYVDGAQHDDLFIFKLKGYRDKKELAFQFFNTFDLFMSVMELGPDDGQFEFKHILPNKYAQLSVDKPEDMLEFNAKRRRCYEERKQLHMAAKRSAQTGDCAEMDTTNFMYRGFIKQPSCFVQYIATDPFTENGIYCFMLTEFALLKADKRLNMSQIGEFIEHISLMIGILELDERKERSKLVYCNKTAAQSEGMTVCDVIGSDPLASWPPSVALEYRRLMKMSLETKEIVSSDITVPRGDDVLYWNATISCLSFDEKTKWSQYAFIVSDKSDIRKVEMELARHKNSLEATIKQRTLELQEKEKGFRSLVSNAPNIILSVDQNGKIEFANRHFTNDDEGTLVGKFLNTMVVDGEGLMTKLRNLFETSKSFILEVKLLQAEKWFNLNAGHISDKRAIIVATDITAIKKMTEELHDALTTKSRFLANMSHEIRTPLSGIIGMSRILMESGLTMDQSECVSTIQSCGETLLSVINSILDYTKLEASGGLVLDKIEMSLQQVIEDSLKRYTVLPTAQMKKLELIIDVEPKIPERVLGDPLRLKQIIINILNNAVKFTDKGYIIVSLNATQLSPGEEWEYHFKIKDTGCGVPIDSQGKLFKMFSQVDVSTTRRYGGTGIGLALAKRLLKMMNGDIKMESTGVPGEGSIFNFSIVSALVPFSDSSPSSTFSLSSSSSSCSSSSSLSSISSSPPSSPSSPPSSLSSSPSSSPIISPRWFESTIILIVGACTIANQVLKARLHAKGLDSIDVVTPDHLLKMKEEEEAHLIVFFDMNLLSEDSPYPLFGKANVVTVLMGYTRSNTFASDFPDCEFLRKPVKENALLRCLRDIGGRFNSNQMSTTMIFPSCNKTLDREIYPLDILVVEDNEINQKVVRRVLLHLGHSNVMMAINGMEALEMIARNGMPDLILMDVQMPVLDGMQTTKLIRSKYPDSHTHITSMTAGVFPEDRKNCLDAGMNDFLTKPIRVEQVSQLLQQCYASKYCCGKREGKRDCNNDY